jgi:hypothetical protein
MPPYDAQRFHPPAPLATVTVRTQDGRMSVANSVQCDLVFLGRIYRGAYLIVGAACGILGRDILNHVSLVLDGPHLDGHEGKDQPPSP